MRSSAGNLRCVMEEGTATVGLLSFAIHTATSHDSIASFMSIKYKVAMYTVNTQ